MSWFKRGAGVRAIRYGVLPSVVVGEDVLVSEDLVVGAAELNILAAYLGDTLVWDGRVSQSLQVPAATAAATAPVASVRADATVDMPVAVGFAEAFTPASVRAGVRIDVPPAVATAAHPDPEWVRDQIWVLPTATASADAPASEGAAAAGSTVFIEVATATADAPDASLSTDAAVVMPVAVGYADAPPGSVLTGYVGDAAVATATADAPAGSVSTSNNLSHPVATGSAGAPVSAVSAGASVDMPTATATAMAPNAEASTTALSAAGLTLGTNFVAGSWATVPAANWASSWASYPLTVKSGDGFLVSGSGVARFTFALRTSSTSTAFGRGIRILRNGALAKQVDGVTDAQAEGSSFPFTGSMDVPVVTGEVITVQVQATGGITSQRTFTPTSTVEMNPVP